MTETVGMYFKIEFVLAVNVGLMLGFRITTVEDSSLGLIALKLMVHREACSLPVNLVLLGWVIKIALYEYCVTAQHQCCSSSLAKWEWNVLMSGYRQEPYMMSSEEAHPEAGSNELSPFILLAENRICVWICRDPNTDARLSPKIIFVFKRKI